MKDATKITIAGLCVLFAVSLPVALFVSLWNFAMNHIPAAETALKVFVTIGCILLGGWSTFVIGVMAASLSVLLIAYLTD